MRVYFYKLKKIIMNTEDKKSNFEVIFSNKKYIYHCYHTDDTVDCNWCGKTIDPEKSFGLVYDERYSEKMKKYIYRAEGFFCSHECPYALLVNILYPRNPGKYSDSERCMISLYNKCYPGKILRPANDFWLQTKYGGPLKERDFVKSQYVPSSNRVLIPTSPEYRLLYSTGQ